MMRDSWIVYNWTDSSKMIHLRHISLAIKQWHEDPIEAKSLLN